MTRSDSLPAAQGIGRGQIGGSVALSSDDLNFLQPAPLDLHTRIELRKAQVKPGVEEPWDKSKDQPHPKLDENGDREGDADADDLMKLAYAKMTAAKKLGGGMSLDEALSMAMKERPDLLERSKYNSLKRQY
jgi:hypothetical protein